VIHEGAVVVEQLAEYVDGLPNICGSESPIDEAIRSRGQAPVRLFASGGGERGPAGGATALS